MSSDVPKVDLRTLKQTYDSKITHITYDLTPICDVYIPDRSHIGFFSLKRPQHPADFYVKAHKKLNRSALTIFELELLYQNMSQGDREQAIRAYIESAMPFLDLIAESIKNLVKLEEDLVESDIAKSEGKTYDFDALNSSQQNISKNNEALNDIVKDAKIAQYRAQVLFMLGLISFIAIYFTVAFLTMNAVGIFAGLAAGATVFSACALGSAFIGKDHKDNIERSELIDLVKEKQESLELDYQPLLSATNC